ncbi:calcium/sodium antiporter [Pseudoalteromonas sp. Cnat2-41]|uniref:calcium/sodium antiporter n=1 Tax=Pseudoalteromonas TaxID=53246 RepID=UPI000349F234|nr:MULTISPECIES: calcium/sodium antiporter [Pseudoalteromonas]MCF2863743.1 calcium/sodium antiporter [Pseudoalteromonas sp. CNAT2-18]MCG7559507.1 calcium/sodium antiporter [Pseudoalteromonas sp. CNAT2-18.1]
MLLAITAIVAGFILLVYSAGRFVDGAAATAAHAGLPTILIGMLIVGFGTSAPEMVVSAMAASDGNPALALGNALGSNIVNIGLILGVTALIAPITVHSNIVRKELPLLLAVVLLCGYLLYDGQLTTFDATLLLGGFVSVVAWSIYSGLRHHNDPLANDTEQGVTSQSMGLKSALFWLVCGLVVLVLSSRILVWGAVQVASALGVSDLVIGLTIVALGTSLPELAASIIAAKKGEHDIAIGNVVGSNMFNILAVIGIAGAIEPFGLGADIFYRDWGVMLVLTLALLVMAYGIGRQGRINRAEGGLLLSGYLAYNGYLLWTLV